MKFKSTPSYLAYLLVFVFCALINSQASALSLRASCVAKVNNANLKAMTKCTRLRNKKARTACYRQASKAKAAGLKKCAKAKK